MEIPPLDPAPMAIFHFNTSVLDSEGQVDVIIIGIGTISNLPTCVLPESGRARESSVATATPMSTGARVAKSVWQGIERTASVVEIRGDLARRPQRCHGRGRCCRRLTPRRPGGSGLVARRAGQGQGRGRHHRGVGRGARGRRGGGKAGGRFGAGAGGRARARRRAAPAGRGRDAQGGAAGADDERRRRRQRRRSEHGPRQHVQHQQGLKPFRRMILIGAGARAGYPSIGAACGRPFVWEATGLDARLRNEPGGPISCGGARGCRKTAGRVARQRRPVAAAAVRRW